LCIALSFVRLAPVSFDPNVFAVAMVPVAFDPASVWMWRRNVLAGDPNVGVAVPAMIAGVPGPVAVLVRRRWNHFVRTRRRANGDVNLSCCDASGEEERARCSEKLLLHEIDLLKNCSRLGRDFAKRSCGVLDRYR